MYHIKEASTAAAEVGNWRNKCGDSGVTQAECVIEHKEGQERRSLSRRSPAVDSHVSKGKELASRGLGTSHAYCLDINLPPLSRTLLSHNDRSGNHSRSPSLPTAAPFCIEPQAKGDIEECGTTTPSCAATQPTVGRGELGVD